MNVESAHDVKTTGDRLEAALAEKGMTLFARIDHSANAEKAGLDLYPTELIIFGNPKVGTPMMECARTVGIDLPQKALIWRDGLGAVWLSYNDPAYLAKRHDLEDCEEVLEKVTAALEGLAKAATSK